MRLKRSSCRNTGGGVRARGILGILAVRVRPAREEDALGRAQRPAEWLLAEECPPLEGGQREEAGQEDLAGKLATRQRCRSALELRAPRT
jgi:hypothetical protein